MSLLKEYLVSRNVVVLDKRTSMRLEPEMWDALREIAHYEKCTISEICSYIALQKRPGMSLTAATRVFLMLYYKKALTNEGREKFHGNLRMNILEANDNPQSLLIEKKSGI